MLSQTSNPKTLTIDELVEWINKLRRSQEFFIPTNVTHITVTDGEDGRRIVIHTK